MRKIRYSETTYSWDREKVEFTFKNYPFLKIRFPRSYAWFNALYGGIKNGMMKFHYVNKYSGDCGYCEFTAKEQQNFDFLIFNEVEFVKFDMKEFVKTETTSKLKEKLIIGNSYLLKSKEFEYSAIYKGLDEHNCYEFITLENENIVSHFLSPFGFYDIYVYE